MCILLLILIMSKVLAQDKMRPLTTIQMTPNGLEVIMDFSHINTNQWKTLLEEPEHIHTTGYGYAGQAGEPVLPQFTELIPIQSTGDPSIIDIIKDAHPLPFGNLKKTPALRLDNSDPVIIPEYDRTTNKKQYNHSVTVGGVVSMMGQSYLPLTIKPLDLDISSGEVQVPESITITLGGVSSVETYPEESLQRSIFPEDEIYDDLGHYLIITPPLFGNYLDLLVDWKRRKGHPVTATSTTETGTSPTAIKAYIQTAYDTWEDPPTYILLIGDEDRGIGGFYVYNPENEALVTDHPYALLDGDDSFPEAWVGRLSVDTIGELMVVFSKILSYESQPYMADPSWFQRGLMVGTVTRAISVQHVNNWVARKLVENGFTQVDTAYYPMQSSLSHVSDPINSGVSFVNYRGLGAWDHWIGPYYYNSDIDNLHNGYRLPIMTSIVCGGGNYASTVDPVFGEKWIRAGTTSNPKGAVAFIGPSEVHTHTQFNNVIDIALYSALFDLDMKELGPALWYAKLELWRNYHDSDFPPFGQSAEFYQNVYNILGDPGMQVWTDVPELITSNAPDTLHRYEDHVSLTILDESGQGAPDAFVHLYNSENAAGLQTDASGQVTLPVIMGIESDILLTVTGRNLQPILKTISISGETAELSYHGWESEGLLIANTTGEMNISLVNSGDDIANLSLTLSSLSEHCVILDSIVIVGALEADGRVTLSNIFSMEIPAETAHGAMVDLQIRAEWEEERLVWQKRFPVQAPEPRITDLLVSELDYVAGDVITLSVEIENTGGAMCPPMALTLLDHPLIECTDSTANITEIQIDESIESTDDFTLVLSDQIFPGEILDLAFMCEYENLVDTLYHTLQVEQVDRFSPSLSDTYGYRVYDEMDVSYSLAPMYNWIEINPATGGSGIDLGLQDEEEEADESTHLTLPFPVNYYGQTYDQITVCTNGWMSMGISPEVNFYNRVIPSPEGPNAMIAPFWDDLTTNPGAVYYQDMSDSIIVEWSGVNNLFINSNLNFQVIIYSQESHPTPTGDNRIKMQYRNFHNYDTFVSFSTIGIESPDYTTGLQVSFDNVHDPSIGDMYSGRALLFTTERAVRLPAPEMGLDRQELSFTLNPWSLASDSIAITNSGGSPLVYSVAPSENVPREPAPNPLENFQFTKGGPEPAGEAYTQSSRDFDDYEWLDQDDAEGPEYNWIDIEQPENRLEYQFDPDDSFIGPIDIGFIFPFYTDLYSSLNFNSNGTLSFVSQEYPWANLTLPNSAAPAALIAPWWDDLNNNNAPYGEPYFWSNGVDTAVVTWHDFDKFGTNDSHSFQVILVGNGDILFQYQVMQGDRNVSTVGIQNATKDRGLQIYYNSANGLNGGDVIHIRRQFSWLTVDHWTGVVPPGETGHFVVNVDTRNLEPASFSIPLTFQSNDNDMLSTEISIDLDVIHGTPPRGDINVDYQVNIIDVTALIEFVLQLETPDEIQAQQMDINGDSRGNILDVVYLVDLITSD